MRARATLAVTLCAIGACESASEVRERRGDRSPTEGQLDSGIAQDHDSGLDADVDSDACSDCDEGDTSPDNDPGDATAPLAVESGEADEAGLTEAYDGGDATAAVGVESGVIDAGVACKESCLDGVVCGAEECDDGNASDVDLCLVNCRLNRAVDEAGRCGDYPARYVHERVPPRSPVEPTSWSFATPVIGWISNEVANRAYVDLHVMGYGWTGQGEPTAANLDGRIGDDLVLTAGSTYGTLRFAASSNGDGTFAEPGPYTITIGTSGFSYASRGPYELNGDGRPDFVTIRRDSYTPGTGKFDGVEISESSAQGISPRVRVDWRPPLSAMLASFADLDGDGRAEAYQSYDGACGWSLLSMHNRGDGTFEDIRKERIDPRMLKAEGFGEPLPVDVAGDRRADLLRFKADASELVVLVATNEGAAGWGAPIESRLSASTIPPTLRDVDGDGRLDLVVVTSQGPSLRVQTAFSRGDGTFDPFIDWTSTLGPPDDSAQRWVGLQDLNGDSRVDLFGYRGNEYGTTDTQIGMAAGRGDGTFAPWFALSTPVLRSPDGGFTVHYIGVSVGDFNGDGKQDFVHGGESVTAPWVWQVFLAQ